MMILLVGISIFTYGIRMAARRARPKPSSPAPDSPVTPALPIASIVDPASYWRGNSGDWTASDERQLKRLLNDSAP
jgi:hypothetical protein